MRVYIGSDLPEVFPVAVNARREGGHLRISRKSIAYARRKMDLAPENRIEILQVPGYGPWVMNAASGDIVARRER